MPPPKKSPAAKPSAVESPAVKDKEKGASSSALKTGTKEVVQQVKEESEGTESGDSLSLSPKVNVHPPSQKKSSALGAAVEDIKVNDEVEVEVDDEASATLEEEVSPSPKESAGRIKVQSYLSQLNEESSARVSVADEYSSQSEDFYDSDLTY